MHSQTERCEQLKDEHIFCTPNRLNSHTDYRKRKNAASELADFSDVFALNNLLENLDGGKFGSVTKDYEKIHAQRMQVINFLSSWRSSLPNGSSSLGPKCSQGGLNTNSDPSMCQNLVRSDLYPSVVDLDGNSVVVAPANNHFVEHSFRNFAEVTLNNNVQNMSQSPTSFISRIKNKVSYVPSGTSNLPGMKDGEVNTSIIILESDDEEDCQVEKLSSKCEREAYNSQDRLESNLQICLRQEKILPPVNHFNQLVPYNQHYSKVDRYAAVEPRWQPSIQFEKIVLGDVSDQKPVSRRVTKQKPILDPMGEKHVGVSRKRKREGEALTIGANRDKDSVIVPSPISSLPAHEHSFSTESHNHDDTETQRDELEDLWKDMSLAMECSKTAATSDGSALVQKEEECIHSYVLEDDLGLVCRICGVIQKSIETIFDNQWVKGSRSTRTFMSRSRNPDDLDEAIEFSGPQISEDIIAAEISVHPRHMKQMKPHQLEGFSFLVRNLVSDKPGGCILAHAPGSGKTFMLISFIQSFLAKYPHARPLVVLPKGILPTWKREFQRWQVEDIPLFDFYSSKADNRYQQLDVLKSWEENKSILFLGYKQFATIVCGRTDCKVGVACQERLLKVPSLLILDEGHTPRNENTDVLTSLAKVQTPRKVVLSGTLFQNHVREVFNILNLVRPKFLKSETSRAVVKRVLSRVHISGGTRIHFKGTVSNQFYDLIEETLQNDDNHNHKRKTTVIQDLRELTHNVLHYYKGDFLDELPGLVDFTVLLKLSDKQKEIIQRLGKYEKFKRSIVGKFKKSSVGNSVYIHPYLRDISENAANDRASLINDDRIDGILDSMDVSDGVKTKFFLNILSMAEAAGEKLLAFSQYLLPMKFLERLIVRVKGWRLGKEIFMITGDSSAENREWSMDQFNNSPDAKVLFGSIKACGEGISLVGASRVLILDVHLNPSVTRQAIGRAFRPGQNKKVYVYRLVAADSPEEEDHRTAFRKELISKMWFEWSEYSGHRDFELEEIDVADSQDVFLESPTLSEDVQILYRR